MRESTKSKLNKIANIAIPSVLAAGAILASEASGFSENIRNYQYAKIQLANQYWGSFFSTIQHGIAYISRVGVDGVLAIVGIQVGRCINELKDYLRTR